MEGGKVCEDEKKGIDDGLKEILSFDLDKVYKALMVLKGIQETVGYFILDNHGL